MKRLAITGVSGYVGSRLLSKLAEAEWLEEAIGIDVRPPQHPQPWLKFYQRDISKPMDGILAENRVDAAVHLAFVLRPTHNRALARQSDIGGTSSFLEACRRARVTHILYLSSHTVYGAHPDSDGPLKEDSSLRPMADFQYSADKAETETMVRQFAAANPDCCVTILRSCPVLGPNGAGSVATAMFKPVMLRVTGYDPPMQFVHEDDLTNLMLTLLKQGKGGIFNVAGDGEIRYSHIARMIGKRMITLPEVMLRPLMGLSWTLRLQRESPASGLEFIKYPPLVSTEKVQAETGFRFRYSSQDVIAAYRLSQGS